jgi:mannose-6-phosphate isomerase-like protein (cupin superfamily)
MVVVKRAESKLFVSRHGSEIRPLIDRTTSQVTQCSLAEELLPPGHAVVRHLHRRTEEIYYILEGHGLMSVDDQTREVESGDAVLIPCQAVHTLRNTGETAMRLLLICGPAFSRDDEHLVP